MDAEIVWTVVALLLLLGLSFFFSLSETALIGSSRIRLNHLASLGSNSAQQALDMLKHPGDLLAAILVGNNLVNVTSAALATVLVGPVKASILLTLVLLVFCEITPKTLAVHAPERTALVISRPVRFFVWLTRPIVWVTGGVAEILVWPFIGRGASGSRRFSRQELVTALRMVELEPAERRMTREVLALRDIKVRDIMIPLAEVEAIEEGADFEQVLRFFSETQATRYPVYRDRPEEIIGLLLVKDLLAHLDGAKENWRMYVRPIMRTSADLPADELLRDMQIGRTHMAVVEDSSGRALGVVTMEDVLEEIVGEIQDETDHQESELVREFSPGRYLVSGTVEVDDLCKIINVDLGSTHQTESLASWFERTCRDSCRPGRRLRLGSIRIIPRGANRFEIRTGLPAEEKPPFTRKSPSA